MKINFYFETTVTKKTNIIKNLLSSKKSQQLRSNTQIKLYVKFKRELFSLYLCNIQNEYFYVTLSNMIDCLKWKEAFVKPIGMEEQVHLGRMKSKPPRHPGERNQICGKKFYKDVHAKRG